MACVQSSIGAPIPGSPMVRRDADGAGGVGGGAVDSGFMLGMYTNDYVLRLANRGRLYTVYHWLVLVVFLFVYCI